MSTTTPRSETDRIDDESMRGDQRVAWYGRDECELCPPVDSPIRIGEVYELVSVMLKHAPFDRFDLTDEMVVEARAQRAWGDFVDLVTRIEDAVYLDLERGSS